MHFLFFLNDSDLTFNIFFGCCVVKGRTWLSIHLFSAFLLDENAKQLPTIPDFNRTRKIASSMWATSDSVLCIFRRKLRLLSGFFNLLVTISGCGIWSYFCCIFASNLFGVLSCSNVGLWVCLSILVMKFLHRSPGRVSFNVNDSIWSCFRVKNPERLRLCRISFKNTQRVVF